MDQIAISSRKFKEHDALIFDKHNNPGIKLHSIQDILELCTYNDIDPKKIQHLIIPNNEIASLDGIEQFGSLKELNLTNNRITKFEQSDINYFLKRMYSYSSPHALSFTSSAKRASFILLLSNNKNLSQNAINSLFQEKNNELDPLQYLHLATSLENLDKYYLEKKTILKSFQKTLGILWKDGGLYGHIENDKSKKKPVNFDDYHEVVRRGMYFITDVSPSETTTRNFTTQDYQFHASILPDVDNKTITDQDKLESKPLFFKQITLPPLKDVLSSIEKKHGLRTFKTIGEDEFCNIRILKALAMIAFVVFFSFLILGYTFLLWFMYLLVLSIPLMDFLCYQYYLNMKKK